MIHTGHGAACGCGALGGLHAWHVGMIHSSHPGVLGFGAVRLRFLTAAVASVGAARRGGSATLLLRPIELGGALAGGALTPAATAGGKGGPHDCCRKGWQTAPPACCMAGLTDGAAATMTARVVAPSSNFPLMSPVPAIAPSGPLARQIVVNRHRDHSPPPIIFLRV